MQKKKIKFLVLFLLITFTLSACNKKQNNSNNSLNQNSKEEVTTNQLLSLSEKLDKQNKIKKFANYDELQSFLEENSATDSYAGLSYSRGLATKEIAVPAVPTAGISDESMTKSSEIVSNTVQDQSLAKNESGSSDFSKTNVQIEGVDEADIIKTDGKNIYAVSSNNLFIVEANENKNDNILAKIEFKSQPQDIYINGNSLIVFGYDQKFYDRPEVSNFIRRNSFTFFKVFDISDPVNPKQVRDLDFEGSYTDSRMIGDYVYFITTNYNYYYSDNEPVLPRIMDGEKVLANKCEGAEKCFAPEVYYFDMPYETQNFVSVNAINVVNNDEKLTGEAYLMSSGQNIFVSTDNIYITYTRYISEYELEMELMKEIIYPMLNKVDQEKIAKIEAVDNFILSKNEKINKIMMIVEKYVFSLEDAKQEELEKTLEEKMKQKYADISKELEKTIIHKIAIKKNDLEYKATGEVTGNVLNQFSMNENKGYFQIATTKGTTWSKYMNEEEKKSYNNLYVLDENLKQVGAVENLAPDEQIYSVRFMQDRAYMVTFKQTDPLFVIDLANPREPKVLGKLKIPGFSSYLHPYDKDTLIGIGKDAEESEWGGVKTKGVKLSLFDVSDVANPKEIDNYILGESGSNSYALSDHKAVLFSLEKNLLVIPVSIVDNLSSNFRGAVVFRVTKDGFELRGKINHYSKENGKTNIDSRYYYNYDYNTSVKRSLYIDENLYTFSDRYLMMNKLDDLSEIKKIELKKEKQEIEDDFDVIN